jgi:hypothetical protein
LLKVAAAATPEVWTGRLNAHGRSNEHFLYLCERDAPLCAFHFYTQTVARRGQPDQNRAAFGMSQANAAGKNTLDCDFEHFALRFLRLAFPVKRCFFHFVIRFAKVERYRLTLNGCLNIKVD